MESAEEKRAKELIAKAEQVLTSWSWFGSSSSKYDDACELFSKAANNFRIAQKWEQAGECFVRVAELKTKTDSAFESASSHVLAAEMFARSDAGKAIGHYREAISKLSELGRFGTAAKHAETIAGLYEKDNNLAEAVLFYQQAADYNAGENSHARAAKALVKVALHSATLGDLDKALAIFEKLGTDSLDSNLLKFGAKKHFLHAGMCALAKNDTVAANNAIARFAELDFTFRDSGECKLLTALTEALTAQDADKFADDLFAYDSINKLDPWETSIFLRVKNLMTVAVDAEDDLR